MSCISSLLFNASQNHYPIAISRFKALKHIPLIIIVMVALYVLQGAYGYLMEFYRNNISLMIQKITK